MGRMSRGALFFNIAKLMAERSTCRRAKVGAIAVRDNRIVVSGYVGSPPGQPHCLEEGCIMENGHCIRTIHAEANLIAWAARTDASLLGSVVYCTHAPCRSCSMLLVSAGISAFGFLESYSPNGIPLMMDMNVKVWNGRQKYVAS